ncbi:hypothetical protein [Planctomycetes bacterium K23_9]|uniref:Uncharacterized protein n=1 Tax=Stieleria marina TaxID=1930275 RepID=A0A517NR26_9BACT|nr:hypothetical protein K239x_15270 [Planctomycetes bacterium K23_9]
MPLIDIPVIALLPPLSATIRSPQSKRPFRCVIVASGWLAVVLSVVLTIGCGRQSDRVGEDSILTEHQGMNAEQFLRSVFSRYRNAESYRDRGQVRLNYRSGGKTQSEVAPLSVWFDRDSLYLNAYDVHLRSTPQNLTAWITDPTTRNFDSQVVRTDSQSGRPAIHAMLSDTVLRERIAAGLAGPPPQLEWLFAAEPMERLFDGPYQIAFGKPVTFEQQECVVVVVQADEDAYRFAIEERSGVIRQVQLPSLRAPVRYQTAGDASESSPIRLTLDLAGATFESPQDQPTLEPLPRLPRFVSHFIPLPPDQPSETLDTRLASFKIRDQSGRITMTHRGIDGVDFTLLLFANDRPSDLVSAANLIQWAVAMPADMRTKVAVGIVTDETAFRRLPRDCPAPLFIDAEVDTGVTVQQTVGAASGQLVVISRDARIVWIQDSVSIDSIARLGRVVGDLIDGVDVPARLRSQWQSDESTYQSVLNAEVARQQQH